MIPAEIVGSNPTAHLGLMALSASGASTVESNYIFSGTGVMKQTDATHARAQG